MACDVGVTCRVATQADEEAVLAINEDVYSGFDYFPDRYDDTINDQSCYCYVLEKDGEIIGFAGHQVLVNDNATIAGMMRLREKHQGKGLIKILDQHILKKVQQDHPGIETYRYVTVHAAQVNKRIEDPTSGYRLISDLVYYRVYTTSSKVEAKLKAGRSLESHTILSVEELMTSHKYTEIQLNIGQVFLYNAIWTTATSTWQNIAVAAEKNQAFATLGEENTCTALSFSDLHKSKRGYVAYVHFTSLDGATFETHLQRQLENVMRKIPPGEADLFIYVMGTFNQETIKHLLAEYGEIVLENKVYTCDRTLKKNDSV